MTLSGFDVRAAIGIAAIDVAKPGAVERETSEAVRGWNALASRRRRHGITSGGHQRYIVDALVECNRMWGER